MTPEHSTFRWIGPKPKKPSVNRRLEMIVNRRMTVDEIEFEYVLRHGLATRRTILEELSRLALGGVIHRVKQGVYEP